MAKKQALFKTKGMNQDLSISAFSPEFAFENMNLRLSTNENNTLMSWVNEKGTKKTTLYKYYKEDIYTVTSLNGAAIGVAVINHNIVVFTHAEGHDYIYKIYKYINENSFIVETLYEGNLGFSTSNPIETLVSYESDMVQKVYWTDGVNQPRVINIVGRIIENNDTQFDFIPTLQLKETVSVVKQLGATGMFAPGVIQYAFTYYNKFGQESNIFYTTPLYYISYKDRGASPEDKVENAFKITVNNVDTHFEYLRIYSIQRTSINAVPICKRIQDIAISGLTDNKASFTDIGTTGESIDPTELLFKGGEVISAETMSQKDDTLFMGNIKLNRFSVEELREDIKNAVTLSATYTTRTFTPESVSTGTYNYANQLTSIGKTDRDRDTTVPCAGFKTGDWYRCGVQLQHESGKWSDPIWVGDKQIESAPTINGNDVSVPIIEGYINSNIVEEIKTKRYKKIRPVVVFPDIIDRDVICQGVSNPTVFTKNQRDTNKDVYAQSSWFFRPYQVDDEAVTGTTNAPTSDNILFYTQRNIEDNFPEKDPDPEKKIKAFNPEFIRKVEIEGDFKGDNRFKIDRKFRTLHSPDIEFDDQLQLLDYAGVKCKRVGEVTFTSTLSDIDIQTESSTISNLGSGFVHKSFNSEGAKGIVSGLFYDDRILDDYEDPSGFGPLVTIKAAAKWLIYPWQSSGSLNNDINRPTNMGQASAILKKKIISNLRYATTYIYAFNDISNRKNIMFDFSPQLFSGEEDIILKFEDKIYKGNIDTSLMPDNADGKYFVIDGIKVNKANDDWWPFDYSNVTTAEFTSNNWLKLFSRDADASNQNGLRKWVEKYTSNPGTQEETTENVYKWVWGDANVGTSYVDTVIRKQPVRMKYKSAPHLVVPFNKDAEIIETDNELAIVEVQRETSEVTRFGGTSADALRENKWLPCGIPVSLDNVNQDGKLYFYYDYGDTYFQRYDCLKTYAYTREDPNQIVEIGSFMLETHINIDGRYDRNRGQINNLNMSPQNFNLLNPVYSQLDNFFTYRIQDDDVYKNNNYPNQITWSKTKSSNADIDLWNNITLASTLELDGNKGEITSLQRLNDQLICFQDQGISQILYNENTQISTTEGVPIEIANSGKVQGKRYLSNTVGCSNKWSIVNTPAGIYFMDSNEKSIYRLGEGLQNISLLGGFNTWCKQHIPGPDVKWSPNTAFFNNFVGYYDKKNQDVLYINKDIALAYSEKVNAFTSFYDYGGTPWFCNLDDEELWIRYNGSIWQHQEGNYCDFFRNKKPFYTILACNTDTLKDKIFTNLEFRACVEGEGQDREPFIPYTPFDCLEAWNEYQHGIANLYYDRNSATHHPLDSTNAVLKRNFRIWRCDIPRDNAPTESDFGIISRIKSHPLDRMRNPWIYLKLLKKESYGDANLKRTEVHDVVMTYYS